MLKQQLIQQFRNPKRLQIAFINFLKANKTPITVDKTIAYSVLNDSKEIGGLRVVDFFSGVNVPLATNIDGDMVRPESEHLVIYKIRVYNSPGETLATANYNRGIGGTPSLQNATIDIYSNGVRGLKNIPLADFIQDATSSLNDRGTLTLDEPIIWQGQTPFKLQLTDKSGLTLPPGALRFDLVGIGLI